MSGWKSEWQAWETAKRTALGGELRRVKPMLVRCGGYGRAVAPSHVNLLGETMTGWSPGQVAYVVRMSSPDGLQLWETVDGSHRVEAARVFGWPYVVIAELGIDLAPEVMASYAIQADVEALRQRYVNFVDKVLVYTRLLEVLALKGGSNECPSINEMLAFDACEKMGQRKARSNLQDFHRHGRLVFQREAAKLALSRFSASLTTDQSHRLSANVLRDHWVVPAPKGNNSLASESVVLSAFNDFASKFVSVNRLPTSRSISAREDPPRARTPSSQTKKRRSKRRVSWSDAVPPREPECTVPRLDMTGKRKSTEVPEESSAGAKKGGGTSADKGAAKGGEKASASADESAFSRLPPEAVDETPWQLSVEEAARTKSIFIGATKKKPQNTTLAQREATTLGFYLDKPCESSEYRLYARRRLPHGTEIPMWGELVFFKGQPSVGGKGLVLLRRLSLCATLVTHLQLSARSTAYYAHEAEYQWTAVVHERIQSNSKADFLRAADEYAEKSRDGRYCCLLLSKEIEADEELLVRPVKPLGAK